MNKPSIAELLSKSGITNFTPALVSRAITSLYGNIGAGLDERNWDAIMSAANPLVASETALAAMYQDTAYLQRNVTQLTSLGYAASQAELTYRQLHDRLGLTYSPGWAAGTSYENLGTLSTADLLSRVQADVAAMKPVEVEKPVVKSDPVPATPAATPDAAPTITFVPGNSGLGVTLNVTATLALSGGGSLGSFNAGTTLLSQQSSVKSGTLTATGTAGLTSSATSQTVILGTSGDDNIDTSAYAGRVDFVFGGDGNDTINTITGDDILVGGAGNDVLISGTGVDTQYGGDGDDRFDYNATAGLFQSNLLVDSIDGGSGTNAIGINSPSANFQISAADSWATRITNVSRIQLSVATSGQISVALHDSAYEAGIRSVDFSVDTASATGHIINVSAETGSANGYGLTGHAGTDTITGGAGNDTITGGAGADSLTGGNGSDTFKFESSAANNGFDTITDFTAGAGNDGLNFSAFLSGGSFIGASTTVSGTDTDISTKVAVLRGLESDVDTAAKLITYINGPGNAFAITVGGKAVIVTGSTTVVAGGSNDYGRIFFAQDANSDGSLAASEVVLVAITQANFDVANLVGGNFSFV